MCKKVRYDKQWFSIFYTIVLLIITKHFQQRQKDQLNPNIVFSLISLKFKAHPTRLVSQWRISFADVHSECPIATWWFFSIVRVF